MVLWPLNKQDAAVAELERARVTSEALTAEEPTDDVRQEQLRIEALRKQAAACCKTMPKRR
ncbi:MAG: hypothetical protein AB7O24_14755 [Kofleriaceae bacterium]